MESLTMTGVTDCKVKVDGQGIVKAEMTQANPLCKNANWGEYLAGLAFRQQRQVLLWEPGWYA